jgi:prepilin peptidase CpaA
MIWLFYLCLLVAVLASAEDLWRRKVSNYLTAGAFASGLSLQSWLFGLAGLWNACLGAVFGFAVFLGFYWLGGMGAGDIKLMAAFGSIVGGERIWLAAILTAILGAVLALVYLTAIKLRRVLHPESASADALPARKASIPYAPAISLGMLLTFFAEETLWTSV